MNHMVLIYVFLFLALLLAQEGKAKVVLTATNHSAVQRQEVVAWDASEVWSKLGVEQGSDLIIKNPYGQTVTYQVTHDHRLLLDVSVRAVAQPRLQQSKAIVRSLSHM